MNKKQLREYFGHRFPQMSKPRPNITISDIHIKLDRAGQVVSIESLVKLKPNIEYNYAEYDPQQWMQYMNWQFRGQPIDICKEQIINMFKIGRA